MTDKPLITHERLHEVLDYGPVTGIFRWRVRPSNFVPAGSIAGSTKTDGYRRIEVDGRSYEEHRLAWFYMTGQWPRKQIDHINCVRFDNRFANLREASMSENMANAGKPRNNTSGVKGVYLQPNGKWRARIGNGCANKLASLGSFDTIEEATAARRQAAEELHGAFVNHG